MCVRPGGRCRVTSRIPRKIPVIVIFHLQSWDVELWKPVFPRDDGGAPACSTGFHLRDRWEFSPKMGVHQAASFEGNLKIPCLQKPGRRPGVLPTNLQQWGLGRETVGGTQFPSVLSPGCEVGLPNPQELSPTKSSLSPKVERYVTLSPCALFPNTLLIP